MPRGYAVALWHPQVSDVARLRVRTAPVPLAIALSHHGPTSPPAMLRPQLRQQTVCMTATVQKLSASTVGMLSSAACIARGFVAQSLGAPPTSGA